MRGVAAVERQFTGQVVAPHQQLPALPVHGVGVTGGVGVGDQRSVVEAVSLRSRSGREPLRGPVGQASGDVIGAEQPGRGRDPTVTADGQHIPDSAGFELGAQHWVGPVDLVPGDPAGRYAGVERAGQHPRR